MGIEKSYGNGAQDAWIQAIRDACSLCREHNTDDHALIRNDIKQLAECVAGKTARTEARMSALEEKHARLGARVNWIMGVGATLIFALNYAKDWLLGAK